MREGDPLTGRGAHWLVTGSDRDSESTRAPGPGPGSGVRLVWGIGPSRGPASAWGSSASSFKFRLNLKVPAPAGGPAAAGVPTRSQMRLRVGCRHWHGRRRKQPKTRPGRLVRRSARSRPVYTRRAGRPGPGAAIQVQWEPEGQLGPGWQRACEDQAAKRLGQGGHGSSTSTSRRFPAGFRGPCQLGRRRSLHWGQCPSPAAAGRRRLPGSKARDL